MIVLSGSEGTSKSIMNTQMHLTACGAAPGVHAAPSALTSTDSLVELLGQMRAEAERNACAIDALDRRSLAGAQQLAELLAYNER